MSESQRRAGAIADWSALGRVRQAVTQLRVGGRAALAPMLRGSALRAELGLEAAVGGSRAGRWASDLVNSRRMVAAWRRQASPEAGGQLDEHAASRFSQNGEDGIIGWILERIGVSTGWFLEIGAADGEENCTRNLVEQGWSGTWVEADGDLARHARALAPDRVVVVAEAAEPDTVARLLAEAAAPGRPEVVVIDIDSNDWWVLGAVLSRVSPRVLVVEYNSAFGPGRWWVNPYRRGSGWDKTFRHGASLDAITALARRFGLALVGCDPTGVNSFFVANADLPGSGLRPVSPEEAYRAPWFANEMWGHPRRPVPTDGSSTRLDIDELSGVSLAASRWPPLQAPPVRCGGPAIARATVVNRTSQGLTSRGPNPFHVAARWRAREAPLSGWAAGDRRYRLPDIPPGGRRSIRFWIPAPPEPGPYRLELAVVQENVKWLDDGLVSLHFDVTA